MTQTELTDDDKERLAELLDKNRSHSNDRFKDQDRTEEGRYV